MIVVIVSMFANFINIIIIIIDIVYVKTETEKIYYNTLESVELATSAISAPSGRSSNFIFLLE